MLHLFFLDLLFINSLVIATTGTRTWQASSSLSTTILEEAAHTPAKKAMVYVNADAARNTPWVELAIGTRLIRTVDQQDE